MPVVAKEILRVGTYHSSKGPLHVSKERLEHFCRTGNQMLQSRLTVPLPLNHQPDTYPLSAEDALAEKVKNNTGFASKYWVSGNSLWGELDVADPEIAPKLETTIKFVSPQISAKFTDGNGKEWSDVITHIALTPRPRFIDQKPFGTPAPAGEALMGDSVSAGAGDGNVWLSVEDLSSDDELHAAYDPKGIMEHILHSAYADTEEGKVGNPPALVDHLVNIGGGTPNAVTIDRLPAHKKESNRQAHLNFHRNMMDHHLGMSREHAGVAYGVKDSPHSVAFNDEDGVFHVGGDDAVVNAQDQVAHNNAAKYHLTKAVQYGARKADLDKSYLDHHRALSADMAFNHELYLRNLMKSHLARGIPQPSNMSHDTDTLPINHHDLAVIWNKFTGGGSEPKYEKLPGHDHATVLDSDGVDENSKLGFHREMKKYHYGQARDAVKKAEAEGRNSLAKKLCDAHLDAAAAHIKKLFEHGADYHELSVDDPVDVDNPPELTDTGVGRKVRKVGGRGNSIRGEAAFAMPVGEQLIQSALKFGGDVWKSKPNHADYMAAFKHAVLGPRLWRQTVETPTGSRTSWLERPAPEAKPVFTQANIPMPHLEDAATIHVHPDMENLHPDDLSAFHDAMANHHRREKKSYKWLESEDGRKPGVYPTTSKDHEDAENYHLLMSKLFRHNGDWLEHLASSGSGFLNRYARKQSRFRPEGEPVATSSGVPFFGQHAEQ